MPYTAMPQRTMSKCEALSRSVAALLAAWAITPGWSARTSSANAVKRSSWRGKWSSPGSSAVAKWVITPARLASWSRSTARTSARASSPSLVPSRPMPVSSFTCTRGRRGAMAARKPWVQTTTSASLSSARSASSADSAPMTRIGTTMSSARRAAASAAVATASHCAPPASAARAAVAAPWP